MGLKSAATLRSYVEWNSESTTGKTTVSIRNRTTCKSECNLHTGGDLNYEKNNCHVSADIC